MSKKNIVVIIIGIIVLVAGFFGYNIYKQYEKSRREIKTVKKLLYAMINYEEVAYSYMEEYSQKDLSEYMNKNCQDIDTNDFKVVGQRGCIFTTKENGELVFWEFDEETGNAILSDDGENPTINLLLWANKGKLFDETSMPKNYVYLLNGSKIKTYTPKQLMEYYNKL